MLNLVLCDSTGTFVGTVRGCIIYDKNYKRVCEVNPKITLSQIIKILLLNSYKYVA